MKLKMWVIFTSFVDDTGIVKEIAYMCNKERAARTMCKKMNDRMWRLKNNDGANLSSIVSYGRWCTLQN